MTGSAGARFNLRQVYVDELIELARDDPRIVSLDSDSREATMTDRFAAAYPARVFSFGIAEQNMVSAAGGMAAMGLIPFVNSYALFIAMRALDQLRNSVAYQNLNVKFVLSHHGLDTGADGITHQLVEDIAIFRAIPNLVVLQPSDDVEMRQMVRFAVEHAGPVSIKSGKTPVPRLHAEDFPWRYGRSEILQDGRKVAVISCGNMVERALAAAGIVAERQGFGPRVINLSSMTDVDEAELLAQLEGIDTVVSYEDHSIHGGLGGLVCEILSARRPVRVIRLGVPRRFAESGTPALLYERYGLSQDLLISTVAAQL
jgi:transketolase